MLSPDSAAIDVWRPIHYLGSKLRVLDPICNLLDQVDPQRGRLCDLFAGSGTVSVAMAAGRAITAVDIQEYSRILCSALLQPSTISKIEAEQMQRLAIRGKLYEQLKWAAEPLIDYEINSLQKARSGDFNPICDLIDFGSMASYDSAFALVRSIELRNAILKTHKRLEKIRHSAGPRSVVLRHFGGLYFSYPQAIELAALLDVAAEHRGRVRHTLMAAVLSTASEIVNTVGKQFAQPIKPRDAIGKPKVHLIQKIIKDRTVSSFPVFSRWLERYRDISRSEKSHRILRVDYKDALAHHCDDVGVVYADPPYTRDHYSRFYHVLETMCLRDDPEIAARYPSNKGPIGRACYRVDRHQSPFCVKSQAPKAFEELFSRVRKLDVPLVLSYSPLPQSSKPRPRVMTIEDISTLALRYFKAVDRVAMHGIAHNKLNTAALNSEVLGTAEVVLICS